MIERRLQELIRKKPFEPVNWSFEKMPRHGSEKDRDRRWCNMQTVAPPAAASKHSMSATTPDSCLSRNGECLVHRKETVSNLGSGPFVFSMLAF
jgi:hypothetical protein